MKQFVKITDIRKITPDVLRITTEKPDDLSFVPGQAVDVSIDKPGWEEELRPFTFTSLPDSDHVEFTIKTYPAHKGVTNELLSLKVNDTLILGDVFGDIHYKGNGVFIAGGAGITPFIAIFRELEQQKAISNNTLIFANKTRADIINEDIFQHLLGDHFVNVLSNEKLNGYEHGYIDAALIKRSQLPDQKYFYLCGPPPMMDAVEKEILKLGVAEEYIVKEPF